MLNKLYKYNATVVKVYDGDTITIATKMPYDDNFYRFSVRITPASLCCLNTVLATSS